MPVETESDLEAIYDGDEFALDAIYTTGGASTPVLILGLEGSEEVGDRGVVGNVREYSVRKSDITLPVKGATIAIAKLNETLEVINWRSDDEGAEWILELNEIVP